MDDFSFETRSKSWLPKILILAFIGVFAWQTSLFIRFGEEAGRQFVTDYSFVFNDFLAGEYYRVFTSIFLHGGLVHLFSNSLVLLIAGNPLEKELGSLKFSFLFIASAFTGSLLTGIILNPATPAIGASGGVMGVLASATLLVPTDSSLEQIPVLRIFSLPILRLLFSVSILGVFFIFQETLMAYFQVYSMVDSNVGHLAHLGGIASGIILSYLWRPAEVLDSVKYLAVLGIFLAFLAILPAFTREWFFAVAFIILLLFYWSKKQDKISGL